jgi:hypothetical protein
LRIETFNDIEVWALWAVPNIEEQSTRTSFIVTSILVGAVNYGIVFNMGFMTSKLRDTYYSPRQKLVTKMQREEGTWADTGYQFEQFKPLNEDRTPTEWFIAAYALARPFPKAFWKNLTEKKDAGAKIRASGTDDPETHGPKSFIPRIGIRESKGVPEQRGNRMRNENDDDGAKY